MATCIFMLMRKHDFPPLRLVLVDRDMAPEGRALRAGALKWADYPVQLQEIHGKVVTVHPNGYFQHPWYALPYKKVGFDLTEAELQIMQEAEDDE
eukprot:1156680-Pelagomonas_calceolata.AAC.3